MTAPEDAATRAAALRDEARSTLSAQAEDHLCEKVTDIARRSRLGGAGR